MFVPSLSVEKEFWSIDFFSFPFQEEFFRRIVTRVFKIFLLESFH